MTFFRRIFRSWEHRRKKAKYYIIYTLVDKMDLMIFFFSNFAAKIPERELGFTLSNSRSL